MGIFTGFYMRPRASPYPNPESGTEKPGKGTFSESGFKQRLLILSFADKLSGSSVAGLFEPKQTGIAAIVLKS